MTRGRAIHYLYVIHYRPLDEVKFKKRSYLNEKKIKKIVD
jgi:hypothetical protein